MTQQISAGPRDQLNSRFFIAPSQVQGCQIFLGARYQNRKNVPNEHTIYQMVIKYSKCPLNVPNGHKIFQHFHIRDPEIFSQIGIFGLKTNHLATLVTTEALFEKKGLFFKNSLSQSRNPFAIENLQQKSFLFIHEAIVRSRATTPAL
jgi:hypothetical protein